MILSKVLEQYEAEFSNEKGKSAKLAGCPNKHYHSGAFCLWLVKLYEALKKSNSKTEKKLAKVEKKLANRDKALEIANEIMTQARVWPLSGMDDYWVEFLTERADEDDRSNNK